MKKSYVIFLGLVCMAAVVSCKSSQNDDVDIDQLSSVNARAFQPSDYEYDYEHPNSFKEAECMLDEDSLSSFIAQRIQYPYDLIGDSVDLTCWMSFDVDDKGNVTKFDDVTIEDNDAKLPADMVKQITPDLKKQAMSIVKQLKFRKAMILDDNTGKWTANPKPMEFCFHFAPYPVEKIFDKDLIVHYLGQNKDFYGAHTGYNGKTTVGYVLQQKYNALTSTDEKVNYIMHGNKPVVKYTAFNYLASKKYPKCADLVVHTLADTTVLGINSGCETYGGMLADEMLHDLFSEPGRGRICTVKDSLMIDSIMFYSPKVKDLDHKYYLLDSLAPTPERYKRARELYNKDKFTHALVLLAKYRKPQDKPFFIAALQQYKDEYYKEQKEIKTSLSNGKMKEVPKEAKVERKVGEVKAEIEGVFHHHSRNAKPYIEALDALRFYPDNDFVPYLEFVAAHDDFNNYDMTECLFADIIAFDNDWAYNLIDKLLSKKNASTDAYDKYHYLDAFQLAYRQSKPQSKRFLPLVNKYKPNKKEFFGYDVDE